MANDAFSVTLTVQYTPPGAAANSGLASLASTGTENAQSVGRLDIPAGTTIDTVFPIPFGGVGEAKVCVVQNLMSSAIGIRLNGAIADDFELGPGQTFALIGGVVGGTTPLISVDIVTTVDPTVTEYINYWTMGD